MHFFGETLIGEPSDGEFRASALISFVRVLDGLREERGFVTSLQRNGNGIVGELSCPLEKLLVETLAFPLVSAAGVAIVCRRERRRVRITLLFVGAGSVVFSSSGAIGSGKTVAVANLWEELVPLWFL